MHGAARDPLQWSRRHSPTPGPASPVERRMMRPRHITAAHYWGPAAEGKDTDEFRIRTPVPGSAGP